MTSQYRRSMTAPPVSPGDRAAHDRRLAGYHQHLADRYRALAQLDEESGFGDLLAGHEASAARYRSSAVMHEQLARALGLDEDHGERDAAPC